MTDAELQAEGFMRVERDDRLVDVFNQETLEKGVTLWEKWRQEDIQIIRIHNGRYSEHTVDRATVEEALQNNTSLRLA